MAKIRPSRSVLTATTALALGLGSAPFAGVAAAVPPSVTVYPDLPDPRTVGPNAGFPGNAIYPDSIRQGVSGRTALVTIEVESNTAIQTAKLRLFGGDLSTTDDFDAADGFSLYKDSDGDGLFRKTDFDGGSVAGNWTFSNEPGEPGYIEITVPATTGASSPTAARYFLTVHPRGDGPALSKVNRPFTATVPAGGIVTSAGNIPASPLNVPETFIDSKAPNAPSLPPAPTTNWIVSRQPPGTEDYYTVMNEAEVAEPGKRLVFFNSANDTAVTNVLKRLDGTLAIHDAPDSTAKNLKIGDGTGRTKTVGSANNGQTDDKVFVRAMDTIGNFAPAIGTPAVELSSTSPDRFNDVTAPTYDAYTVSVPANINTTTVDDANNGPNEITVSGAITAPGDLLKQWSRLFLKAADGTAISPTPYVASADLLPAALTAVTHKNSVAAFAEEAVIHADAYLVDDAGNQTLAVPTTNGGVKDTVQPMITGVSLLSDVAPVSEVGPGDKIQVTFNESMDATSIRDDNGQGTACDPGALPTADPDNGCVNYRLRGNGTDPDLIFGTNPGFDWGAGNQSAVITVGGTPPASSTNCQINSRCVATITFDDMVVPIDNTVFDARRNKALLTPKGFGPLLPLPTKVETDDNFGGPKFAQKFAGVTTSRDGVLDSITLTWDTQLSNIGVAPDSFEINSGGNKLTPSSIVVVAGPPATVKLNITPPADPALRSFWQSGALPTVFLLANKSVAGCDTPPTLCTGLQSAANGRDVPPFSRVADDKAGPSVMSVTTRDTNKNGKIDRLIVQYSEAINHDAVISENRCGYSSPTTAYNEADATPSTDCTTTPHLKPDPVLTSGSQTAVILKEGTAFDTAATPRIEYKNETPGPLPPDFIPIQDLPGNVLTTWDNKTSDPTIDGAGPFIVERRTKDNDNDGQIDQIDVQFTETLSSVSVGNGIFTITEPTHGVVDLFQPDAVTVGVKIDENAGIGKGDTGVTPKIAYAAGASGGITDINLSGPRNPAPDSPATVAIDKAAPAIVSASFNFSGVAEDPGAPTAADDGLKMLVKFSEAVPAANTIDGTKFAVTQGARTAAATAIAATTPANDQQRILTFAAPTYDLFQGGTLRMTAFDVLKDAGNNLSKQTFGVPFFGYPTARLDLTGPAGSNPGYSTELTFDTGAGGTNVAGWLFVIQPVSNPEPAPPTDPDAAGPLTAADDPRFEATKPDKATVTTDGTYKAWLWTKDAIGNITHKNGQAANAPLAEDTITVVANAQSIGTPEFVNATNNSPTLRNGDQIRVKADAYGTDAAQWVGSNGACLPQYMSIDYRQVTNNASKGQVAPVSCQLFSGSPPRRRMEFPFVPASGVENYPVGTALKSGGSTDPGYVIEDSPTGVVKRRFYSLSARRTWQIKDAHVITVPTSVLNGFKSGPVKYYRDGSLIRATGSTSSWIMDGAIKRGLPGAYANYYGYSRDDITYVPAAEINAIVRGTNTTGKNHLFGSYVKTSGNIYYTIVRAPNGRLYRRQIVSQLALPSLVPGTHILPANSGDLALPLDTYLRGYRDGVMLKDSSGRYYVISRGNPRLFANSTIFITMGFNNGNATGFVSSAIGRMVDAVTYTNGVGIDFYDISVTITVRNVAGRFATKVVLLRGRGTPEPAPAGLPNDVPRRP